MNEPVREQGAQVIEYPENYEDMKKKYLEREEEKLKLVLAKRNAENQDQLKEFASKSIEARALKGVTEHKPLKDRKILREAKSEDIQDLKKQLNEEIRAIGQRILQELPKEAVSLENKVIGLKQLKGRITQNPPAEESHS